MDLRRLKKKIPNPNTESDVENERVYVVADAQRQQLKEIKSTSLTLERLEKIKKG